MQDRENPAILRLGLSSHSSTVAPVWFFFSLVLARALSLVVLSLMSGTGGLVSQILVRVLPGALVADLLLISVFLLFARSKQVPLVVAIIATALVTHAGSFGFEAMMGRMPDGRSLMVSYATGVLYTVLFLSLLFFARLPVALRIGVAALVAVLAASTFGDLVTFLALGGNTDQMPLLWAALWNSLKHGTVFAFVLATAVALRPARFD
jgi:hypothetical protein